MPASQDNQARRLNGSVDCQVKVSEQDKVVLHVGFVGITLENRQVATVVGVTLSLVRGFKPALQSIGDEVGKAAERFQKSLAFHRSFEQARAAEPVPVSEVKAKAVDGKLKTVVDEGCAEGLLIKGAEPGVVISRQDGQRTPSAAELGKAFQAWAEHRVET